MLLFFYGVIFATIITPIIHKIAELLCVIFDVIIEKISRKIVDENSGEPKRVIGFADYEIVEEENGEEEIE